LYARGIRHDRARSTLARAALLGVLLVLVRVAGPSAHEIPTDVTVQAFLHPEGQRLDFLVRVPLLAMRDIEFPRRAEGYLDLAKADASLRDAATLWISDYVALYENDRRLTDSRVVHALVSLPSDKSFASYQEALAHVAGPRLPDDTDLYWEQGMLDVLFEYPIQSAHSDFSIEPNFEMLGLRVVIAMRFLLPSGAERVFEFSQNPGLVRLDPRWHQAAWRFVEMGFFHILDGIDHLLFLLCLVIPFRSFRALIPVVTSFTVAHSITLIASAFGLAPNALWFPPLIETLIALSIVYMAFENIFVAHLERRWIITFWFGLVHGFGFSFALSEILQFAGSHLLTSLMSFNLGVELGQLLVLLLFIPALELLYRYGVQERVGTLVLSALVAHTGWHWMVDRAAVLSQFPWPTVDAAALASAMRWLMAILILAALSWYVSGMLRQPPRRTASETGPADD
jgi:hypothetical protein